MTGVAGTNPCPSTPPQGAVGPVLLNGELTYRKTADEIAAWRCNLADTRAWLWLTSNLTIGNTFTLQLVPDLADDVILRAFQDFTHMAGRKRVGVIGNQQLDSRPCAVWTDQDKDAVTIQSSLRVLQKRHWVVGVLDDVHADDEIGLEVDRDAGGRALPHAARGGPGVRDRFGRWIAAEEHRRRPLLAERQKQRRVAATNIEYRLRRR